MRSKLLFFLFFTIMSFFVYAEPLDMDSMETYIPFDKVVSFQKLGTNVIVASTDGVAEIDITTNEVKPFLFPQKEFHPTIIKWAFEDPYSGQVFVLTRNYLYIYYPGMKIFKKHQHLEGNFVKSLRKIGFSLNYVYLQFNDGTILRRMKMEIPWHKISEEYLETTIKWYPKNEEKKGIKGLVKKDDIVTQLKDGPYLWIGTKGNGFYKYNYIYNEVVFHYVAGPLNIKNTALYEEKDNIIIGGNRVKKIAVWNLLSDKWSYIPLEQERIVYDVYYIGKDKDSTITVAGYHFVGKIKDGKYKTILKDTTVSFLYASKELLISSRWIKNKKDTLILEDTPFVADVEGDTVWTIIKDSLYVVTPQDIWKYDLVNMQRVYTAAIEDTLLYVVDNAHVYKINLKEAKAYQWDYISPHRVNSILKKGKYLFLGTEGSGILVLDMEKGKWIRYNEKNGLPSNYVYKTIKLKNGIVVSVNKAIVYIPFKEEL